MAGSQFRPGLIICVGEAGALIREYLSPYYGEIERRIPTPATPSRYHLLSNLDSPLRESVGLLQVDTQGPYANQYTAIPFPIASAFPDDPDIPVQPGPLEEMIYKSLVSVQLDRRILAMRRVGYTVSNTRTQIFIVGEPTPENKIWMQKILRIVRETVRGYHFETPICYFLNCYETKIDYSSTLHKKLGTADNWRNYEMANFGYLYEHMISYPTPSFVNRDEVRYATAQALLAMVATGVSSTSVFESEMQLPHNLEDYAYHVGNISTSMILFPRAGARFYCSALLTKELMQKWRKDLDQGLLSDSQREKIEDEAHQLVDNIEEWLADSVPRPRAEASAWPSFRILRRKDHPESAKVGFMQRDTYFQLVDQTHRLFDTFSADAITEEYRARQDKSETWVSIAYDHCNRAVGHFSVWEQHAKDTWQELQKRIGTEVRHQVDQRWPESKNGFEVARVYIDMVDKQLTDMADHISRWYKQHRSAYRDASKEFLKLADGVWAMDENKPSVQGVDKLVAAQATPTIQNAGGSGSAHGGIVGTQKGGGGRPDPLTGPQYLSGEAAQIARDLRKRANWKHGLIPSIVTLCSTSLLGWITTTFTVAAFALPKTAEYIAMLVILAISGIGSGGYRMLRQKESQSAQAAVLDFYRWYYIHCCEQREDLERMDLMKNLQRRVHAMRRRIDDMGTFLDSVGKNAGGEAARVSDQLFNGPAGARDIFIANGERLGQQGSHSLDNVAGKVEQSRRNRPLQDWHRTLDTMRDELIGRLRQRKESLLEMEEERVAEFLYDFTGEVVDGYLVGSLVEISAALNKPEIWREVLDHVSRPLYYANVGNREPRLMFVCGSERDLKESARYIPPEAIKIRTKSSEWLMIVAFFRGGSPTAFDAQGLSAPKSSAAGAPGGGIVAGAPPSSVPKTGP